MSFKKRSSRLIEEGDVEQHEHHSTQNGLSDEARDERSMPSPDMFPMTKINKYGESLLQETSHVLSGSAIDESISKEHGVMAIKSLFILDEHEREKLVCDLVRLFLFTDSNKYFVRKKDIKSKILGNYKGNDIVKQLVSLAEERLMDLFGFELIYLPSLTVDSKNNMITHQSSNYQGVYMVRLSDSIKKTLDPICDQIFHQQCDQMAILMVILGCMYTNKFDIEQDTFWRYMERLEFDRIRMTVDELRVLVDRFVKQGYLAHEKNPEVTNETPLWTYRIGARSLIEVGKANILKYVARVCYSSEPDPILLAQMLESDKQCYDSIKSLQPTRKSNNVDI